MPDAQVIQLASQVAVVLACMTAAFTDSRSGRIPNWLTLPLLAAAPLLHGWFGGVHGVFESVLGLLLCGVVPLFLFTRNAMGGGDVKLFAGLGALVGPSLGIEIQLCAYIALVVFVGGRMAWNGELFRLLRNVVRTAGNTVLPERLRKPLDPALLTEVRMGMSIFAAALLVLAQRHLGFWP